MKVPAPTAGSGDPGARLAHGGARAPATEGERQAKPMCRGTRAPSDPDGPRSENKPKIRTQENWAAHPQVASVRAHVKRSRK